MNETKTEVDKAIEIASAILSSTIEVAPKPYATWGDSLIFLADEVIRLREHTEEKTVAYGTFQLYEIDDGASTWIVARSVFEAAVHHGKNFGSVDKWLDEVGVRPWEVSIKMVPPGQEITVVNVDDEGQPRITMTAVEWADQYTEPHFLACSEY